MKLLTIVISACLSMLASAGSFDQSHAGFTKILEKHANKSGVDYAGMKKEPAALATYLDTLADVPETAFKQFSREQQMAFLINLYNAATLKLIVANYPVKSIRDIGAFWDFKAPWHLKVVHLYGRTLSLDDLEQKTIRPGYAEPRVHFALVCAAKGCPPLRSQAYTGGKLEEQLEDQARVFLNQKEKNAADPASGTARLSPIFKWYLEDFGGSKPALLAYLRRWLPVEAQWKVVWTGYDWSLNEKR